MAVMKSNACMKINDISKLRSIALSLLLPGLAGLIVSSMISMRYLDTMPKFPDPESLRMTPRMIDGMTVYQTEGEDRQLDITEYSSITVFLTGLGFGLVYLRKWGIAHALECENEGRDYGER